MDRNFLLTINFVVYLLTFLIYVKRIKHLITSRVILNVVGVKDCGIYK